MRTAYGFLRNCGLALLRSFNRFYLFKNKL
jgi:hypothetical protein